MLSDSSANYGSYLPYTKTEKHKEIVQATKSTWGKLGSAL